MGNRPIWLGWLLVLFVAGAGAQTVTVYVTDQLRLGLHVAEDTSDGAFRTLLSGQQLEVLERNRNYAKVRTLDGEEGWVKANYLVDAKPAALRVSEMEATVAEAAQKLALVEGELKTSQSRVGELESRMSSAQSFADENVRDVEQIQEENENFRRQLEIYRSSVPLTWALGAGVVFMTLGFLAGLWWLDARIRRRHGGFRIY